MQREELKIEKIETRGPKFVIVVSTCARASLDGVASFGECGLGERRDVQYDTAFDPVGIRDCVVQIEFGYQLIAMITLRIHADNGAETHTEQNSTAPRKRSRE